MNPARSSRVFHLAAVSLVAFAGFVHGADWPQAAGPNANFAIQGTAPTDFSVTHNRNILWRAPLPSTGQGTPIVSHGRVFVTSHEAITADTHYGSNIVGICFDAGTGRELWRRTIPGVRDTDLSSLFSDNTAASPVADGRRVCFVNVGGRASSASTSKAASNGPTTGCRSVAIMRDCTSRFFTMGTSSPSNIRIVT